MGKAFVGKENQLKMRIIKSMKLKFQVHLQKYEALNATHSSFAL